MRYSILPILIVASIISSSFTACWTADGPQRLADKYDTDGDMDIEDEVEIPEVELGEIEAESLAGHWAMRTHFEGTISPIGAPWPIKIDNIFIAEINDEESEIALTFCNQVVKVEDSNGMGESLMPEKTTSAIAAETFMISLPGDGTFPATTFVWTWGLGEMDDMENDPLPTEPDDPLVIDQDEDDHPGVTVQVVSPEGERYMVRRGVWNMDAATITSDLQWAVGSLEYRVDEQAVDASIEVLKQVAPITSNEEGNLYQLRRVESDYDCESLREEYLGIFQDAPEL